MPTHITFLAGRRRWLRLCGAGLLAGSGLGGCERGRQTLQPAPVLTVIEERQTQFGRLAVVDLQRMRYLAYGPGTDIVRLSG